VQHVFQNQRHFMVQPCLVCLSYRHLFWIFCLYAFCTAELKIQWLFSCHILLSLSCKILVSPICQHKTLESYTFEADCKLSLFSFSSLQPLELYTIFFYREKVLIIAQKTGIALHLSHRQRLAKISMRLPYLLALADCLLSIYL
jgi:hypothetical protein